MIIKRIKSGGTGKLRQPWAKAMIRAVALLVGAAGMLSVSGCASLVTRSQTQCLNNEKQLSIGVLMYVQDYDERYPPTFRHNPAMTWAQTIYPYIKSSRVYQCPDDSSTNVSWAGSRQSGSPLHSSYMTNYQLGGTGKHTVTIGMLMAPASTIYLCDGGMQAGTGGPSRPNGISATSNVKDGCWILQDPGVDANGGHAALARGADPN